MGFFLYRLFILDGNFWEKRIIENIYTKMEGKKIAVTKSFQEGSWSDPAPESALLNKELLFKLIPKTSRKNAKNERTRLNN